MKKVGEIRGGWLGVGVSSTGKIWASTQHYYEILITLQSWVLGRNFEVNIGKAA
jgi:hypothetical protein